MQRIEGFTLHGESGVQVLQERFLDWLDTHSASELGSKIVAYSWRVNGREFKVPIDISKISWRMLPDASGFVCFESDWRPDNCVLLDAFGQDRMRLSVPWQLTRPMNPASANPPTSFTNISEPYTNPVNGKRGEFGLTAWVEFAGHYYFELDYHVGQFLWGRPIRD